jgi:hypothetical protein
MGPGRPRDRGKIHASEQDLPPWIRMEIVERRVRFHVVQSPTFVGKPEQQAERFVQSAARGDRSHGDLRCTQRHRTTVHTSVRSQSGPSPLVAPRGGDCRGVHSARRPVPVPCPGAGCELRRFGGSADRSLRCAPFERIEAFVYGTYRARACLGNRGRARGPRLARDRRPQRRRGDRSPEAFPAANRRLH